MTARPTSGKRWRAIQDTVKASESLADLSDAAERLFWRLVAQTDPWGRMPGSLRKVRANCVPLLDWDDEKLGAALGELQRVGRVEVYAVAGDAFLQVRDFEASQPAELIRRRGPSRFPAPPGVIDTDPDYSGSGSEKPGGSEQRSPREEERRGKENHSFVADATAEVSDALADVLGCDPKPTTKAGKARADYVADLVANGATGSSVRLAADAYRKVYPTAKLTDRALATHYPQLHAETVGKLIRRATVCSDCEVAGGLHSADCSNAQRSAA